MKVFTGLLTLMLISALVLPEAEARGWFRRVVARVKSVFCSNVVSRVCERNGVCSWINRRVCSKRDLDSIQLELRDVDDGDDEKHLCPMPVSFDIFDVNEDDRIDAKELAKTFNMNWKDTQKNVIDGCDRDGDNALSEEEFEDCPFVFEDRLLDSGKQPQFIAKQRKERKKKNKNED
ncbi:unnamed protein product [Owenia fusiformis]|uniref:Uncharacterized protein n=1 Tax=Owenia fusiformis TaxID=6347 RepID=A0A8J1Y3S4_OWEFU|nr:unnamed protein product [Owenia fusiformis]